MASKNKELSFEAAVKELEQTVKDMESGELGLDDLLDDFEKGIGLLRLCEKKLGEAEGRIEVLTKAEIASASKRAATDPEKDELEPVPVQENEAEFPF